jgi:hypothetical protein
MPSLVTLPFIQCHHVCGRADAGGDWKPDANGSVESVAAIEVSDGRNARQKSKGRIFIYTQITKLRGKIHGKEFSFASPKVATSVLANSRRGRMQKFLHSAF